MNVYIYIFLLLILCFLMEDFLKKKPKIYKGIKHSAIFLLVLFIGLRGVFAPDAEAYYQYFLKTPKLLNLNWDIIFNNSMEPGYTVLNSIIKSLGINFSGVFFLVALISLINLHIFINYFSDYYFYALTFYYTRWIFLKEFMQIRNGLACSFIYLAFIELEKNNWKKYLFLVIVGSLFHKAVLIGLCFPIFLKFYKYHWIKICTLVSILSLPVINLKEYLIPILLKIGVPEVYVTGYYSVRKSNMVIYYGIVILIMFLILNKYFTDRKIIFLRKTYVFSILLSVVLLGFGDVGGRLPSFFNVEFLIESRLIKVFKQRKTIKILAIIFLLLLFKVNFINRTEKYLIPYQSYISQQNKI